MLTLIAEGLTNPGDRPPAVVGEETVKTHVDHLFAEAGLRDSARAVGDAHRHGLAG